MSEIAFSVRRSSRDRLWSGLEAIVYDASAGVDETLFARHCLSMHIGDPVGVTTRCDGKVAQRVQVRGDIKLIPAGFSRIWEIDEATQKLSIYLSPALLQSAAEDLGVRGNGASLVPQLHVRDQKIEYIAWALEREIETDEPMGRLYAESLGLALCAHLLRRYASLEQPCFERGLPAPRLRRVVDYVEEHLTEDVALEDLARVANVSPSHFNRLFKRSMGLPAHQYVLRRRVELAIRMLSNETLALRDVAAQAGFASQSHMATSMRRIAGTTPGAFRRVET